MHKCTVTCTHSNWSFFKKGITSLPTESKLVIHAYHSEESIIKFMPPNSFAVLCNGLHLLFTAVI